MLTKKAILVESRSQSKRRKLRIWKVFENMLEKGSKNPETWWMQIKG